MDFELNQLWTKFQTDLSVNSATESASLFVYLILGGILSVYYRFLYHKFSVSASNTDSVTRVFPLLTLVTIGVIAVVKSSLALSLGLVGALSIVRFRAAIKEPEELVYLFLCIGTGLCLGAGNPILAMVMVLASTIFIVTGSAGSLSKSSHQWMLTIGCPSGDSQESKLETITENLQSILGKHEVQRFDSQPGFSEIRILLTASGSHQVSDQVNQLKKVLPDCELSYFNLSSSI